MSSERAAHGAQASPVQALGPQQCSLGAELLLQKLLHTAPPPGLSVWPPSVMMGARHLQSWHHAFASLAANGDGHREDSFRSRTRCNLQLRSHPFQEGDGLGQKL